MFKKILFWFISIIIFVSLSLVLLIAVAGYRVNWINFSIHQTSLVWLKGSDSNVEIFFDNKKIGEKLPLRINYVDEGWREVRISKKGYYDWKKSFYVQTGQAYEFRDIMFFKKGAKPEVVSDKVLIDSLKDVILPLNIVVDNGDLIANNGLISRFSKDPVSYQWYRDGKHIIYQIDNEIRVIDTAGINDNLLATLGSVDPSVFRLIDNGKSLLYKDGEMVKKIKIR